MKEHDVLTETSIWIWLGRIIPMVALFVTVVILAFSPATQVDWLLIIISSGFAATTFSFWWWVVYTIKETYHKYEKVSEELNTVCYELVETQKLLAIRAEEVNHDHHHDLGQRRKSTKSKS